MFCGDGFEVGFSFAGAGYPARQLVPELNSRFFRAGGPSQVVQEPKAGRTAQSVRFG